MRRQRVIAIVVVALLLVGVGAAVLPIGDWLAEPAAVGTPAPAAPVLTAEESAFYAFVSPRLRTLHGEAGALLELGRTRSRNFLELQERNDRVDEVSAEIDKVLEGEGAPVRFAPAMDEYAAGIAAARSAMRETRAGISRLDWDRVGRAVDVFGIAVERLAAAMNLLEAAGAGATPSPR